MPRGGRRPGSGRKTNAQINTVRSILGDTMTDAQWKRLFRRLNELALDGNMRAAALLLNYRFGDPNADPDHASAPPIHIRTIEAHLSDYPAHPGDPDAGPVPFVTIEPYNAGDDDDDPDDDDDYPDDDSD